MKTKKQTFCVKNFTVTTDSDVFDGELMDTQVFISGEPICVMSGVYIEDFVADLRKLIDKYAI